MAGHRWPVRTHSTKKDVAAVAVRSGRAYGRASAAANATDWPTANKMEAMIPVSRSAKRPPEAVHQNCRQEGGQDRRQSQRPLARTHELGKAPNKSEISKETTVQTQSPTYSFEKPAADRPSGVGLIQPQARRQRHEPETPPATNKKNTRNCCCRSISSGRELAGSIRS
jgi:hypothetical protein